VTTDYRGAAEAIARHFAARGWSAETVDDNLFPYARLAKGDCRMVAAAMAPNGALEGRFAMQMHAYGPVTYFYRGRLEAPASRAVPVVSDYLLRKLSALGIEMDISPVIAIAAGPRCRLSPGDWDAIRVGTTVTAA